MIKNKEMEMKEIYLDNAATTRVYPEVAKKVSEIFLGNYGNGSSQYSVGRKAREELNLARKKIAGYVECDSSEIVFTSGGTESNNLAIRGLAKANPNKKHIVTSIIEHPSVMDTCRDLEKNGYKVDYVGVDKNGVVSVGDVEKLIREDTLVVSIMHVNNEIGTVQPIEAIGKVCKKKNVYFHTDTVQGFSKLKLDLKDIDLMSVSGHKVHAPKGVGFLYVKKGTKISAIMTGGGQERGLRSGTENIPGIVGLAEAIQKIHGLGLGAQDEVRKIRDKMVRDLLEIPGAQVNGSLENRIYNNINVSFYGIEGESLMLMLNGDGICVSTGSACASTKLSESYVLRAIDTKELYIHGSLRITLGSDISEKDVNFVVEKIRLHVDKLRKISPFKLSIEDEEDSRKNKEVAVAVIA